MKRFFIPDAHLPSYLSLSPQKLKEIGVSALILDIDNTLAPYEQSDPDEALFNWVKHMKEGGIRLSVVSNNHPSRILKFSDPLDVPVICNGWKPFPFAFRRAMHEMGSDRKHTAALGDQIFTDVTAARLAGLFCVITVPPIKDKTDALTRFKRLLEKPYMQRFAKKGNLYDLSLT